ncbi:MAG: amidohydrolase family protein [Deltaproteobacteria bacterium]|nr:amidohydrolase family protein [Deltaproteobacteria bacterium]
MISAALLIALALSPTAYATGLASPGCTVIAGAKVYTPTGPQDDLDVLLRADRIERVGPGLNEPGCARVEAKGLTLTPGFVEPWAQLGLIEVDLEGASRDDEGRGPDLRAAEGYNPRSSVVPVTRVAGVTSVVIAPSGGGLAGQAAWVDLAGGTQAEAVQSASVAMVWAPHEDLPVALYELRALLEEARSYGKSRAAWEQNRTRPYTAAPRDLDALQPVLRGELPLVVTVDRAADIESILRFAKEERLRIVILGGAEAWRLAEALAEAKVPVILDPLAYGPSSFTSRDARPDNAALLHAAGVDVMISSRQLHNVRVLGQNAGNAVREGLPHDAAITALTATPARVFGLTDLGVVAPGARANLVLWSGDPLELSTTVTGLWIGGEAIPLVSRQTLLRDRYLTNPAALPAPSL